VIPRDIDNLSPNKIKAAESVLGLGMEVQDNVLIVRKHTLVITSL